MNISAKICTLNRATYLKKVLNSIKKMIIPGNLSWELIIVDNNSNDNTEQIVVQFGHTNIQIPVIYHFEGRQGKSYALNTGIDIAKGDIEAFTDDDATVDRNWLKEIKDAFENYKCVGIGGKIIPIWPASIPKWYDEQGPYRLLSVLVKYDLGESPCIIKKPPFGANIASRKKCM